jgi:hypothetical protein
MPHLASGETFWCSKLRQQTMDNLQFCRAMNVASIGREASNKNDVLMLQPQIAEV